MPITMRATVDKREIARVAYVLNGLDRSLVNELRSTMSRALKPIGEQIAARANAQPIPMSGMTPQKSSTKWRWGQLKVALSVSYRFSKKGNTLVSLDYTAKGRFVGMYISERAGSKNLSRSNNPAQGARFVQRLNAVVPGYEKGGRYMFRASLPYHKHIYRLGENILTRWIDKTNTELEKM